MLCSVDVPRKLHLQKSRLEFHRNRIRKLIHPLLFFLLFYCYLHPTPFSLTVPEVVELGTDHKINNNNKRNLTPCCLNGNKIKGVKSQVIIGQKVSNRSSIMKGMDNLVYVRQNETQDNTVFTQWGMGRGGNLQLQSWHCPAIGLV